MKKYTVSEIAKQMGVSVRTLHYYDEIGLLKPAGTTAAGYRFYEEASLLTLQQILFYRELEFSLSDIGRILADPQYDKRQALAAQRALLMRKRQHLDALIGLVDATIGGDIMKTKTTMTDVREAKAAYAQEAQQKWGDTEAYRESEKRHAAYGDAQELEIAQAADAIFAAFADNMDADPAGPEAQALVKTWQDHITRYHYPCTPQILSGLADMYTGDPRFTENIDRFGDGTAQFMHDAIKAYCG